MWYGLFFFGATFLLLLLLTLSVLKLRLSQYTTSRFFPAIEASISVGSLLGSFLAVFSYIHAMDIGASSR
jgi:hypothetical protein